MDEKVHDSSLSGPIRKTPCIPDKGHDTLSRSLVPSHKGNPQEGARPKKTAISPCSRAEAVGWIRSSWTLRAWVTTWRVPTLGRTGSYRRVRNTTVTRSLSMIQSPRVFENGHSGSRVAYDSIRLTDGCLPGPHAVGRSCVGPPRAGWLCPYWAKQLSTGRSPLVKNFSKRVAG
jgi:hypothetical protein